MSRKKPLNLILAIAVIASMLIGVIPAGAQTDPGPLAAGSSYVAGAQTDPGPQSVTKSTVASAPTIPTDETQVPHYFGPYPNWALSPVTVPDVAVEITGDGTGATAVATVGANGAVTGITITNPGSGYTTASVVITGGDGLAAADPDITLSGVVTAITVDAGGAGYTDPVVTIGSVDSGGATTQATAFATGGVDAVSVAIGGTGYTPNPTVEFDMPGDPDGTTATGHAILDESGVVTAIVVDNPGSGYYVAPGVRVYNGTPFDPINCLAAAAAAKRTEIMQSNDPGRLSPESKAMSTEADSIDKITEDDSDTKADAIGRDSATLATVAEPANCGAVATTSLTIQGITLETFGEGYTSAPDVLIEDPTGDGLASATATVAAGGVTAANMTNNGSGYITPGGMKKFVDPLPGLCDPSVRPLGDPLNGSCPDWAATPDAKAIPLGAAEKIKYPLGDPNGNEADQYEIGLVQYRTSFSSSLPPTLARGYVQLETPANSAISQHFALYNEMLNGDRDYIGCGTTAGCANQVYAVTAPQWLGPVIAATKDKAVRIIFRNLLPTGSDGDLFLPTDSTLMGSGMAGVTMFEPESTGEVTDEARNPLCSQYPKPDMCFKDNRATLHLHGGISPWISDGTPHQWITPANQTTNWPQGVSVENVPDMNACAEDNPATPDVNEEAIDGCMEFYYTNQQSARLMFYHDHAWGITRLNVYAGEAAGYLISDDTEKRLMHVNTGVGDPVPTGPLATVGLGIPLVVQERTFVPDAAQLAAQDPTWNTARWGGYGSFWYHHVYMPAQNPGDPSGMSAYGRWMYGPWFWPPAAATKFGPIANPYYGLDPDGVDNIRGNADDWQNAQPCNIDDPATWQYDTDPFCEPELIPGTPNVSTGMEQFNDTPVVNGVAYPTITLEPKSYRFRVLNAANDRFFNFQWYVGDPTTASTSTNSQGEVIGPTEVALNPAELLAAQTDPVVFPTPVQGSATAGPDWIQIGTEGGFLPAPVVVDGQQPTTWITDPTRFDVGNVDLHSLLLAPAERADVIVDFSRFAGKTLILYNDAPAAFPARVPSYDYYTGAPDLSPNGAPAILPGYGPNTRTIMQVKIAGAPAPAFNVNRLRTAFAHKSDFTGVFESGQHPIIVGQSVYNSAYGASFATSSNCNAPPNSDTTAVSRCDGLVRINDTSIFGFNTLKAPATRAKLGLEPKAIHDEMNSSTFDEFGRMQANLGLEAQPPTPGLQNVVLYPYVNPSTEFIDGTKLPKAHVVYNADGLPASDVKIEPISDVGDGTQIWRITHNGVDTHPIHFHLYDVQVLNRVAWDNIISLTDKTELGWKDTVRMNPLQDTIVALRPIIPEVPWELPNAIRSLSPMMTTDSVQFFNNVDAQGIPTAPIVNNLVNFGWEYVYHCHILSHEEMDMMRPVTLALPPLKADGLAFNRPTKTLTWNDNSINETEFLVQRSTDNGTTWVDVGTSPSPLADPNTHGSRSLVDPAYTSTTDYLYQVVAKNAVGYGSEFPGITVQSISDSLLVPIPPLPPTDLQAELTFGPVITLTWTDNSLNETGFVIERATNGGAFAPIAQVGANMVTYVDDTAQAATTYDYRVAAFNATGNSDYSNVVQVVVPSAPAAPTVLTATVQAGPQVTLAWTDNATNETGFVVERSTDGVIFVQIATPGPRAGTGNTTYVDATVQDGLSYTYRVAAINAVALSAYSNLATANIPPTAPSNLIAGAQLNSIPNIPQVLLQWADRSTNETGFEIERCTTVSSTNLTCVGAYALIATAPARAGTSTVGTVSTYATYVDMSVVPGTGYRYRVRAVTALAASTYTNNVGVGVRPTPAAPTNVAVALVGGAPRQVRVTWTDNATNESGYRVQRSTSATFASVTTVTVGANEVSYQTPNLTANTQWYFRVQAINLHSPSAWVNATPFPITTGN